MLRLLEHSPDIQETDITSVQQATWDQMQDSPDITAYLAEVDGLLVGYTSASPCTSTRPIADGASRRR